MARRPQTRHALSVPQHECASSARHKTSSRSAYEGRRLLRAPVNGVRRRVRGPAAGPKPGLLADFHETQKKTPVAGIIRGATATKIATACRRDAFSNPSAVVSALTYMFYLEYAPGSGDPLRNCVFACVFGHLRIAVGGSCTYLAAPHGEALLLYENCDFCAPADMQANKRRPSRSRDAGAC